MCHPAFKLFFILPAALFFTGCSSMLYYPSQDMYVNEKLLEVKPESIEIQVDEKQKIHSWYFQNKKKKKNQPIILFFHGNGQNLSSHFYNLFWILKHDYDYLILDYPGYGMSPGTPSPKNTVESGKAAIQWAKENHPKSKIAVFAQSLGGAVAMRAVIDSLPDFKPCQFTIDSSFDSYQSIAKDALSKTWVTWLFQWLPYLVISDKYAPEGELDKLSGIPKLIIHADKDPVVAYKFGQKLYSEMLDPKGILTLHEESHGASFNGLNKVDARKKYLEELKRYCR